MSFTSVALTGTVELSPGVAASGAVVAATLSATITDGTIDLAPETVTARTAADGTFSQRRR